MINLDSKQILGISGLAAAAGAFIGLRFARYRNAHLGEARRREILAEYPEVVAEMKQLVLMGAGLTVASRQWCEQAAARGIHLPLGTDAVTAFHEKGLQVPEAIERWVSEQLAGWGAGKGWIWLLDTVIGGEIRTSSLGILWINQVTGHRPSLDDYFCHYPEILRAEPPKVVFDRF